jgi:hypothetical protein
MARAAERRYDKPRLDKLGVVPGMRVAIVDVDDPTFLDEVRERTVDVVVGPPGSGTDLVFLGADTIEALGRLAALRSRITAAGGIWVISRKGRRATLRDIDVIAAARDAGLVDNKVVAFSETHTALRLVVPRALRGRDGEASSTLS